MDDSDIEEQSNFKLYFFTLLFFVWILISYHYYINYTTNKKKICFDREYQPKTIGDLEKCNDFEDSSGNCYSTYFNMRIQDGKECPSGYEKYNNKCYEKCPADTVRINDNNTCVNKNSMKEIHNRCPNNGIYDNKTCYENCKSGFIYNKDKKVCEYKE